MINGCNKNRYAESVEDCWPRHRQNANEDDMWCTANNKERSDAENSQDQYPMREIESPSVIRSQRSEEVLFLNQSPTPHGELDICRSAPYCGYNGECYPPCYMACESHGVVEHDRHYTGVEHHERNVRPKLPSLETMPEGEGKLG